MLVDLYGVLSRSIVSLRSTRRDVDAFTIDASIDPFLEEYQEELSTLTLSAQGGEIDRETFEDDMETAVIAMLLFMFTTGSGDSQIPLEAMLSYETELRIARESIVSLANDIYDSNAFDVTEDRDDEAAEDKLLNRVVLWVAAAAGLYSLGQLHSGDERRLRWELGNTEQHCTTCLALAGQVATVLGWRASGWRPRSTALACQGWRCDCNFVETREEPGVIVV